MTDQLYGPNPQCLVTLLHNSWVAWLPELNSPIQLGKEQLQALGDPIAEVDPAVITQMREQNLLQDKAAAVATPRAAMQVFPDPGPGVAPEGFFQTYRFNCHLALQAHPAGLLAYSDAQNCFLLLPVSLVLTLTEPTDSSDIEQPLPNEVIQSLENYGLLVRKDRAGVPHVRKNAAVAFARYAVGGIQQELRDRNPEADLAGRMPVYFAGCIDLAMDMSYGYLNLALGMLMASIRTYDGGRLCERYYLVPHFLLTPAAVQAAAQTYGPGVAFFSNYIWAHEGNLKAAAQLKSLDSRFINVLGGPQAPSYNKDAQAMLSTRPEVDVLVRGEGEMTAADLLDRLGWNADTGFDTSKLEAVQGLTLRAADGDGIVRTADRPRLKELDQLPSPYLEGVFDSVPRDILYGATLETNRGCPYGCTFCDWGSATQTKIRKFDLERVRSELDWIGRAGISVLFCADANFGIFKRDIEIARMIADTATRYGSLKQVVTNYAKNATGNLTEIIRIFAEAGLASEGIISIQTRDEQTLQVINRANIKTNRYDELLDVFRDERLPMSTDLMIGLPGATTESFKDDLQHYFEAGVQAKAYLTRVLVNSPMAAPDYRARHGIETDEQGFMRSCSSYTEPELNYMLDLFGMYSLAIGYGLLKYLLSYLQWDHGIRALDFVDALLREIKSHPGLSPRLSWTLGFLDNQKHSPGGWRPVLEEAAAFAQRRFGIEWDPAMETVLLAQEAVLADPDKAAQRSYTLQHDVVRYFHDGPMRGPLSSYQPGELNVKDPYSLCLMDPSRHYQYDTHSVAWELESELNDVDRPVFFLEKESMLASLSWPKRTAIGQRAW